MCVSFFCSVYIYSKRKITINMALGIQSMNLDTNMNPVITTLEEISLQPTFTKSRKKDIGINKFVDSSKRKLSSLDSQRIIGVLEDMIRKSEIVTLLPFVVENFERYSVMLGSDLCSSLQEYDRLQCSFSKACSNLRKARQQSARLASRESQRSSPVVEQSPVESPQDLEMLQQEAQQTVDMLSNSLTSTIQIIMRKFKLNPTALQAIKDERKERSSEANTMIDQLNQLQEVIFSRLVTSPVEETEKHKLTMQMMTREKKAQALIIKLELELKQTRKSKEDLIHEKNEVIRKLKSSISNIEQETDLSNRKMISDAQKVEVSEIKNSDGKKSKLQQEVIQLKQRLQTQVISHKDTEMSLRKRKYKIETEVENWIQKYDSEMGEKQDDLDELTELYNEEQKQLKDLEKRFEVLEETYQRIMEERRVAKEKREAAERELRVMVRAATLLQALWRAYRCRKALKQKQKKGKKGKGKGGKKKK